MAINRALMNRQMYNMGGPSLETGAPDITLTGDMRPTYSAMRKQRLASGGIAGIQPRQGYFLGSIVDKIRDDLIPNEIKENPVVAGLVGAGLLNQFGLPDFITKAPVIRDYLSDDFGKNFLGNLINKDLVIGPGGEQISDLSDANVGFEIPKESTGGYFPSLPRFEVGSGYYGEQIPELIRQTIGIGPDTTNMTTNQKNQLALEQYKRRNLQADLAKALAAGTAAGAYVESQPKDTLPTDTTGIDIPAIAQAARGTDAEAEAAGLRFLPPQDTRLPVAQGGRIEYSEGGDESEWRKIYNKYKVKQIALGKEFVDFDEFVDEYRVNEAQGGRIGYANGMGVDELPYARDVFPYAADVNPMKENRKPMERIIEAYVRDQYNQGLSTEQVINNVNKIINKRIPDRSSDFEIRLRDERDQGRRMGYDMGGISGMMASYGYNDAMSDTYDSFLDMKKKGLIPPTMDFDEFLQEVVPEMSKTKEPNRIMAQEGGLMDLGGMEKDYREEGGFVPIGGREKADDVPARLSKNEFVFTADAVRNAGGGDIDEGAAVMERMMKNLEQGGQVSEESQGLEGAREMFETSQRLEKRII
jgi:hypothetical protein